MHPIILEKRDQLIAACKRFDVARLDIFGSAARGDDFNPVHSDADFLVTFRSNAKVDLYLYLDIEEAFENILGRKVDLIDRHSIKSGRNYIRRRNILEQAEPIYVA